MADLDTRIRVMLICEGPIKYARIGDRRMPRIFIFRAFLKSSGNANQYAFSDQKPEGEKGRSLGLGACLKVTSMVYVTDAA